MSEISTTEACAQVQHRSERSENVRASAPIVQLQRGHARVSAFVIQRVLPLLSALEIRVYLALVYRQEGWQTKGLTPPRVRASRLASWLGSSPRRTEMAIQKLVRLGVVRPIGSVHRDIGYALEFASLDELAARPNVAGYTDRSDRSGSERPPLAPIQTDRSDPPDTLSSSIRRPIAKDLTDQRARGRARARAREGGRSEIVHELVKMFGEERWGDGKFVARCVGKLLAAQPTATAEEILAFAHHRWRLDFVRAGKMPPALALAPDRFGTWLEHRRRREQAQEAAPPPAAAPSARELGARAAGVLVALGARPK